MTIGLTLGLGLLVGIVVWAIDEYWVQPAKRKTADAVWAASDRRDTPPPAPPGWAPPAPKPRTQ